MRLSAFVSGIINGDGVMDLVLWYGLSSVPFARDTPIAKFLNFVVNFKIAVWPGNSLGPGIGTNSA